MKTRNPIRISTVEWTALVLAIVGALNWGLVGIGEFVGVNLNLVNLAFGSVPAVENLVFVVVGLAGLYMLSFGYQLYGARARDDVDLEEREPAPR